jgi:capsular polysaccharide biosynthesis protein
MPDAAPAVQQVTIPPVHAVASPAFRVKYPRVRNGGEIEPGALEAMEVCWAANEIPAGVVEVGEMTEASVVLEGLVLDDAYRIPSVLADEFSAEEIDAAATALHTRPGGPPRLPGTAIMVKRRAAHNYGHFLIEMLPFAVIGRQLYGDRDPYYVLHRVPPASQDVALRAMRLLGIDLGRVVINDYLEPVHFETVVYFSGLTRHGAYMSPLALAGTDAIAAKVPPGPRRRLFVTRVPGYQRGRSLLNEVEVARRLAAIGYEAIEPSTMTLEEQVAAFAGAEIVVGVSGAAMTNIAFCRPGTQIIALVPGTFPDTFFWFIAQHKELDYMEIRGMQATYDGEFSWNAGFYLSEQDIAFLETVYRRLG